MGIDWKGAIAPRVDKGLAAAQYAELLAGSVITTLSRSNITLPGVRLTAA